MKRIFLLIILLFVSFSSVVSAHGPGSISFLKIADKTTKPYFLEDAGVFSSTLKIPKDAGQDKFLIDQEIAFEIDAHKLEDRFPEVDVSAINFIWDFGDGTKKKGIKNTHQYKKPGSYILGITANAKDPEIASQLSENVLIHVLPNKEYKLPQATITINGQKGTKENYNILDIDLNKPLAFEATDSKSGSSKIKKYTWDFGDEKSSEGKTVKHQYQLPQAFATVVLRVEDENGLFADAFINVRNSGINEPNNPEVLGITKIAGPLLLAVIATVLGIYLKSKRKNKKI